MTKENEPKAKRVGKRISTLRKDAHRTVISLADELGINRKTLESYERGDYFPTVPIILQLSSIFDCEPGYLLDTQEHKKKESGDISDYTGLSPDTVEALHKEMVLRIWEINNCSFGVTVDPHTEEGRQALIDHGVDPETQQFWQGHYDLDEEIDSEEISQRRKEYISVNAFLQYLILHQETIERISHANSKEWQLEKRLRKLHRNKEFYKKVKTSFDSAIQMRGLSGISIYDTTEYGLAIIENAKKLFCSLLSQEEGRTQGGIFTLQENDEEAWQDGDFWIQEETDFAYTGDTLFYDLFLESKKKSREYEISEMFMEIVRQFNTERAGK